jgi:copper(I)-binding protein
VRLAAALAGAFSCLALAGQHTHVENHAAGTLPESQDRADTGESGESDESAADIGADAVAPLQLSLAWVRAMPPGRDMTAAYLTVANPTDSAITIRGARSSRGDASLHENRRVDGQVQMRALAELTVPAHAEIKLEPGGLHIMLMDLANTPAEGEQLRLCLVSTAGTVCADAPVLRRAPDATTSPAADAGHRH